MRNGVQQNDRRNPKMWNQTSTPLVKLTENVITEKASLSETIHLQEMWDKQHDNISQQKHACMQDWGEQTMYTNLEDIAKWRKGK